MIINNDIEKFLIKVYQAQFNVFTLVSSFCINYSPPGIKAR